MEKRVDIERTLRIRRDNNRTRGVFGDNGDGLGVLWWVAIGFLVGSFLL